MSKQSSKKRAQRKKRQNRNRIISRILKNNLPKLQYISEKTDASFRKQKHSRKPDFCKALRELATNCVPEI